MMLQEEELEIMQFKDIETHYVIYFLHFPFLLFYLLFISITPTVCTQIIVASSKNMTFLRYATCRHFELQEKMENNHAIYMYIHTSRIDVGIIKERVYYKILQCHKEAHRVQSLSAGAWAKLMYFRQHT